MQTKFSIILLLFLLSGCQKKTATDTENQLSQIKNRISLISDSILIFQNRIDSTNYSPGRTFGEILENEALYKSTRDLISRYEQFLSKYPESNWKEIAEDRIGRLKYAQEKKRCLERIVNKWNVINSYGELSTPVEFLDNDSCIINHNNKASILANGKYSKTRFIYRFSSLAEYLCQDQKLRLDINRGMDWDCECGEDTIVLTKYMEGTKYTNKLIPYPDHE